MLSKKRGGQAIWYLGPSDCYEAGAALYDNARHESEDFRFAVYTGSGGGAQPVVGDDSAADDNNAVADDAGQTEGTDADRSADTSNSSVATSSTDNDGPSGSVATSGRTNTGVAYGITESTLSNMPSTDEILKMTREARAEDAAFDKSLMSYMGTRIAIVVAFFLVLILLAILAIWLIVRHNKKKKELEKPNNR